MKLNAGNEATETNYRIPIEVPVSVIIPCYNNELYLVECVSSINDGIFPNEIIIIDGCSTDNSLGLAYELASQYANITVISRVVNGGAAEARRDGIMSARNLLIALVDADDKVEKDAIADAYEIIISQGADICIWDMWRFEKLKIWPNMNLRPADFPKTGRQAVIETLGGWHIHPLGVAYKRLYISAYSGFSEKSLNADELLTRLVFSNADKVAFSTKKYFYRSNLTSSTRVITYKTLTTLKSSIWLLGFAKQYPEADFKSVAKTALAEAWYLYIRRGKLEKGEAVRAISRFMKDFTEISQPARWIWLYPKYLFAFLWLTIVRFWVLVK
tara:strand:+ start:26855 stop:27841 length:987 start_codon:yes stop_codon:yes gene_type:complete